MKPKVLKTEKDHREALKRVEALWNAPKGSPQVAELELWAAHIEAYEREHHPVPTPDPLEAVRLRVEQAGLEPTKPIPYSEKHVKLAVRSATGRPGQVRLPAPNGKDLDVVRYAAMERRRYQGNS
jgi:HTH-type transcriptional regulator/antitoxin HigA